MCLKSFFNGMNTVVGGNVHHVGSFIYTNILSGLCLQFIHINLPSRFILSIAERINVFIQLLHTLSA